MDCWTLHTTEAQNLLNGSLRYAQTWIRCLSRQGCLLASGHLENIPFIPPLHKKSYTLLDVAKRVFRNKNISKFIGNLH